ncbi:MAG: 6-carboxytetrahydropterin synthase QueD [Syntrophobacterales bacterium]|jgi:6-pyruvoyltetrahydropterin/6-carboxytetrahydropterin synthase|nr:6-carboxytetrahydropterin synthase QueD [Syntrophobacterales bacterium]
MADVFEIYVKTHFAAAHTLRGYQGDCARLHGHNWHVELFVRCERLDDMEMGVDFRVLKENINEIMEYLDHQNLNDLPMFARENPTSEAVARYLYRALSERLNDERVSVARVRVSETQDTGALYWEE